MERQFRITVVLLAVGVAVGWQATIAEDSTGRNNKATYHDRSTLPAPSEEAPSRVTGQLHNVTNDLK